MNAHNRKHPTLLDAAHNALVWIAEPARAQRENLTRHGVLIDLKDAIASAEGHEFDLPQVARPSSAELEADMRQFADEMLSKV